MRISTARFISVAAAVVLAMGALGCKSKPKDTSETTNTNSEWKESPSSGDTSGSMSVNLGLPHLLRSIARRPRGSARQCHERRKDQA